MTPDKDSGFVFRAAVPTLGIESAGRMVLPETERGSEG